MEIKEGRITNFDERGVTIFIPISEMNLDRALLRRYDKVQVGFVDGRTISPDQRKKAHAMINEIADWSGELPEYIKRHMKLEFLASRMNAMEQQLFSLSDCDVTTAREFISFLIDFMLRYDVPSNIPLYELCDDIQKYVYACLMNKKCAKCGGKGDLHHEDRIGMGGNRKTTYQLGKRVISLCPKCHDLAHTQGLEWLFQEFHLEAIPLTVEIAKVYKIPKKALTVA